MLNILHVDEDGKMSPVVDKDDNVLTGKDARDCEKIIAAKDLDGTFAFIKNHGVVKATRLSQITIEKLTFTGFGEA